VEKADTVMEKAVMVETGEAMDTANTLETDVVVENAGSVESTR
jgi:hypothetical protein